MKEIKISQVWKAAEGEPYAGYYLASERNWVQDAFYMRKIESDGTLGTFGFYAEPHFPKSNGFNLEFAYDSMEEYLKDFLKTNNDTMIELSKKCIEFQKKCEEMTKALEALEDEWSACEKELAESTKGKKSFVAHGHLFVLEPDEESYQINKIETLC